MPESPRNCTQFTILDETDEWIVVNKPAPLLVHPSKPSLVRTLWDELKDLLCYELACGGQISIITRLDRETSGVVLIAKRADVAREFSFLMQERCFSKRYLALIWDWPKEDRFTVDAPLRRQGEVVPSAIWLKRMVHPGGQQAFTEFTVVRRFERETSHGRRFSLMEARPLTGRMHQIRVHLSHVGHPIVGDKIYGPDSAHYLRFIETGWTDALAAELLLPRHALHAATLSVQRNGVDLSWSAPLPEEMNW